MAPVLAMALGGAALAFASSLAGCGHAASRYNYAAEPDPRKTEYVLGPSDVLRINVWRNPDLSGDATVRPDGTITLPLVGDLHAAGRTPGKIRAEIAQRLGAFIKDDSAMVTVAVATVGSYHFTIVGNAERPGDYASNHYVTVSEALTLAGGPNRFSDPTSIVIIRNDERGLRRIPIDYTGILDGTRSAQDLPIVTGDTLYIP
jgi:polysaccharide export outer membrane protein